MPQVNQALVNDMLRDMLNQFLFVYLDGILIFSETKEKHVQNLRLIVRCLLENQLFVKPKKCEFHSTLVTFLGFVGQRGQLVPDPSKVSAEVEWHSFFSQATPMFPGVC